MYLHQFVKQNDPFVRFFKRVHIPDEIFFQIDHPELAIKTNGDQR